MNNQSAWDAAKDRYGSQGNQRKAASSFDVKAYAETYGYKVMRIKEADAATLYCLDRCPFDSSHGPDAAIGIAADGTIFFKCFHNGCQGRTWPEARKLISGGDSLEPFMGAQADEAAQEPEAQGTAKGKIQFVSAADLCSEPRPVKWLIRKHTEEGSLGMTFGEPEAMKTFNALDQGLSVATGHEWHGHPVQQGPVFYLAGEGHAGLSRRIKAWAKHHKVDLKGVPFFVSDQPAQFLDAQSALDVTQAVDALCKEHGKPTLIIIDTLNRNFGPGDENATQDMTKFIATIDKTIRVRYGCKSFSSTTVVLTKKGGPGEHRLFELHSTLSISSKRIPIAHEPSRAPNAKITSHRLLFTSSPRWSSWKDGSTQTSAKP